MQRLKASDFPQEVLNLFDRYVHGGIGRREFIDRASKYAVGGMTATAMFEALKPNFALGEQISASDSRIKAQEVSYPSPQGNAKTSGYLVQPANAKGKLPAAAQCRGLSGAGHAWRSGWGASSGALSSSWSKKAITLCA